MKKLISTILCFSILFGVCTFFSVVGASEDAMYSGGSGTEEDPYLIGTVNDIRELNENIEKDPTLYSRKVYYKLISDITVPCTIGPFYITDGLGPNCYIETQYDLYRFYSWDQRDEKKEEFEAVVGSIGPLAAMARTVRYPISFGDEMLDEITRLSTDEYGTFDEYFSEASLGGFESYGDRYHTKSHTTFYDNFYRSAAFTGVFDGNGHTLTVSGARRLLFGFVANGAEIKNLKVKAYGNGSFAYSIDSSCTVRNCSFNADAGSSVTYVSAISDEPVYSTVSGFIVKGSPTFIDCINNKAAVIAGTKESYVDLGGTLIDDPDDKCYSLEECKAAEGDRSAFEHLDFENTWTMIDGMPALKLFCEKGDLNFDGGFNGKDANVMKSLIVSGTEGHLYASVRLADLNSDGTIDAKDANLLKQMIIG